MKRTGGNAVRIDAEGDIADICRLTCLELGIAVSDSPDVPIIEIRGLKVFIRQADLPGTPPPGGDGKVV
jgi:hypothetical protein